MAIDKNNFYLSRHLKIFDLLNYEVVSTFDYPSSILSVGVLVSFGNIYIDTRNRIVFISYFKPSDKSIYVGMSDGLLSVRERKDHEKIELMRKQNRTEKYNPYKYNSPNFVNSAVSVTHKFSLVHSIRKFFSSFFSNESE
jgi:hypothetical protein